MNKINNSLPLKNKQTKVIETTDVYLLELLLFPYQMVNLSIVNKLIS